MAIPRRRVLLVLAAGVIALSMLTLLRTLYPNERPISEYPTLDRAISAGAIARGWIPSQLPNSARSLWEQHDLDTNQVFLHFELPETDRARLVDGLRLRELNQDEIRSLGVPRPWNRTSWFEALVQQAPANDTALNARIYVTQRTDYPAFVAMDRASEVVYVWTTL